MNDGKQEVVCGPNNPHPLSTRKTELVWEGKYDEYGNRGEVDVAGLAMLIQSRATAGSALTIIHDHLYDDTLITMLNFIRRKFHPLWHLRKIAWFRDFQTKCDFPVLIRDGNVNYYALAIRDFSLVVGRKNMEVEFKRVFDAICERAKITHLLDIGANIGTYGWRALNRNPKMNVWFFEPDPVNARLLQQSIQKNAFANIHLEEVALSDSRGDCDFYQDRASGAAGSLIDHSENEASLAHAYNAKASIRVKVETIDELSNGIDVKDGDCLLLKIDVEGAENKVLKGGARLIERYRPIVMIETFDLSALTVPDGYEAKGIGDGTNYILFPKEKAGVNQLI